MRVLRIILALPVLLLALFLASWVLLPRGYILLKILEKKGFPVYPEAVREGLLEATFYRVHFSFRGLEARVPEVRLFPWGLEVPCPSGGALRASYRPPARIILNLRDFPARCLARKDFERASGRLLYLPGRGLFGELTVSGFRSPTGPTTLRLRFRGSTVSSNLFGQMRLKP